MLPTRSRGAAGKTTQTSAALTSGRGCRPLASPLSPTGSCSAATWSHRARIPHTGAAAKCAGLGVSPGRARPGPESRGRGPAAALGCELCSGRLQQPGEAAHGAARPLLRRVVSVRVAVFSACQDCSTPLRPPPETTFNSPGGSRCFPAGGQRDSGCRGEGGARERRLLECASSFLGEERATLSSRSPRDCSPDVTPPPTPTRRRSGSEGGVPGARTRGV